MNTLGAHFARAITPAIGNFMAEAGGVCLEYHQHQRGVEMYVTGYVDVHHELDWPPITAEARDGWANLRVATEWGAAGVATLLAKEEMNYSVVKQSWIGTGFDYWLAHEPDIPHEAARMEISGLLTGGNQAIKSRVNVKMKQTRRSDYLGLPAYVVIVEFNQPAAHIEERMP